MGWEWLRVSRLYKALDISLSLIELITKSEIRTEFGVCTGGWTMFYGARSLCRDYDWMDYNEMRKFWAELAVN